MKEPTQADYEAGRILHQTWYNVARAIAPPFGLIDKFDRLRWIETAKVSNAAQPVQEPFGYWHWEQPMTKPLQGRFVRGRSDGKLNGVAGIALYTTPPLPEQEPVATMKMLHTYGDTTPPKQEPRNFCSRCGKRRGGDVNYIHTCTPPRGLENT